MPWAGIELMQMWRQGQLEEGVDQGRTSAAQCYALAASSETVASSDHTIHRADEGS